MTCNSCPYCQWGNLIFCKNCPSCQSVENATIQDLPDSLVNFYFKKALTLSKQRDLEVKTYIIQDKDFLMCLKEYHQKNSNRADQVSLKNHLLVKYPLAFQSRANEDFFYHLADHSIKKLDLLGIKLDLQQINPQPVSFEYYTQISDKKGLDPNTCAEAQAHVVSFDQNDVNLGIDGFVDRPKTVTFFSTQTCGQESANFINLVVQTSSSFLGFIMANYFQEIIFSFLNNKDVFDSFKFVRSRQTPLFGNIEKIFSTFDRRDFFAISKNLTSFVSNVQIRSGLLDDYGYAFTSLMYQENFTFWFEEYYRQLNLGYSTGMLNTFACKYNLILPEYLGILCLLIYFGFQGILMLVLYAQNNQQNKSNKRAIKGVRIQDTLHNTFLSSVLLVYFYNLISFCSLMKFARTSIFGVTDFCILCVRGGFIVYPLLVLYKKAFSANKKEPKRRPIPAPKQKADQVTQRNKVIVKGTTNFYSFWEQKKDEINVFLRVSFTNSRPMVHKKKDVFLQYKLKVIEQHDKSSRDKQWLFTGKSRKKI